MYNQDTRKKDKKDIENIIQELLERLYNDFPAGFDDSSCCKKDDSSNLFYYNEEVIDLLYKVYKRRLFKSRIIDSVIDSFSIVYSLMKTSNLVINVTTCKNRPDWLYIDLFVESLSIDKIKFLGRILYLNTACPFKYWQYHCYFIQTEVLQKIEISTIEILIILVLTLLGFASIYLSEYKDDEDCYESYVDWNVAKKVKNLTFLGSKRIYSVERTIGKLQESQSKFFKIKRRFLIGGDSSKKGGKKKK